MPDVVVLSGWTGSEIVRLSVLWGYTGLYVENEALENVGAGDRTLTFSTVGAGEVWVVTCFIAWCVQANPSRVDFYHHDGTTLRLVGSRSYAAAYLSVECATPLYLNEDSYLQVIFRDCGLNDDIRATAHGYKMAVAW